MQNLIVNTNNASGVDEWKVNSFVGWKSRRSMKSCVVAFYLYFSFVAYSALLNVFVHQFRTIYLKRPI